MAGEGTALYEILELVEEVRPEFPMCTANCELRMLEIPGDQEDNAVNQERLAVLVSGVCRRCKSFPQCEVFVFGLEIGTKRMLRRLGLASDGQVSFTEFGKGLIQMPKKGVEKGGI